MPSQSGLVSRLASTRSSSTRLKRDELSPVWGELGAKRLGELGERLDGDNAAAGQRLDDCYGIDSGTGAVIHDRFVTRQLQERHHSALRQSGQARRSLEAAGVFRIERVGHQAATAATVVISNAGGLCRCFFTVQRFMALTMASRYLSGKSAGSRSSRSILLIRPAAGS